MNSILPLQLVVLRNKCKPLNYYSNTNSYLENISIIKKQRKGTISLGQKIRRLDYKTELYNRQGGRCEYCNQVLDSRPNGEFGFELADCVIHHVIPLSSGGGESMANLSLLHENCHRLLHKDVGKSGVYELQYRSKNKKGSYS